jgi:hypothetical protein
VADCEKLQKCPFFHDRMDNMPGMADMYKRRYCQGSNFDCARHMVFREGGLDVPGDLFPNEVERARAMVEGAKQTA